MKSKVLSLLLMLMAFVPAMKAQQLTPLPLDPSVKSGVLPNGLSYYILHNEEPKGRANFYIAQKVGSTLEEPTQLGLAHFLEHMAFNGTSHYPGKNMLEYLQRNGIRFGADINAYTSFDETVYNINNVPTDNQVLMDSVLLALYDWSGSILLEETEINAERGVIQEEWRSRNDAMTRMYTAMLPAVFDEYQYEQMPIGKMEVVMNFKPEELRAYYHKWYRPDQQGIVIVGDFDADAMEAKVKELFSTIPMPENAAERTYPAVSDNQEPIYFTFADPELRSDLIFVAFKYDKTPFEYRNTLEAYVNDNLFQSVLATLINNRLAEYAEKPECKYAGANVRFGDYFVAKTKGALTITIVPKGNDPKEAFVDAMAIVARACKTGFTDSELERVNAEMLSMYDKLFNEKDKTNSDARASEIIRHFIDNEPAPGIETEYELVKNILPTVPASAYNELAKALLTPENQVVVVAQHQTPESVVPAKETMLAALNEVLNTEYTAYVDEVITDPLIASLPAPGKVVDSKENAAYGTTEMTLSNGVKVIVKTTDFASDEILMAAIRKGGKMIYSEAEANNVLMLEDAFSASKMGAFDVNTLKKYLAGKNVGVSYELKLTNNKLIGNSTVKDLPTLMELVYTSFTNLNPDPVYWQTIVDRFAPILANQEKNPNTAFSKLLSKTMWNNEPLMAQPGAEALRSADYEQMFAMLQESMKNAADYTFVFTGNVDVETLRPLLEQYVATLPSTGAATEAAVRSDLRLFSGNVDCNENIASQTPSVFVAGGIDGNGEYNIENDINIGLIADILDIVYTASLREEEGGTYGAQCIPQLIPVANQWTVVFVFQTNEEMKQKLIDRAWKELGELLANGASADDFNKVKEAALAQFDINARTNSFWVSKLTDSLMGYNMYTGYRDTLQNLTLEKFNKYMSELYNGQNRMSIVLDCVTAE